MGAMNKVYNVVLAALVIIALALAFIWQKTENQVKELEIKNLNLSTEMARRIQEQRQVTERLNAEHEKALLAAHAEQERQAAFFKDRINEINDQYRNSLRTIDGLHGKISNLNSKITTLSRTQLETYATTGGDNLAECSAVVGEVEYLARQYYEEREFYRKQWPVYSNPKIVATDTKSGAMLELGSATSIPLQLDKFRPVTP